jgi:hypothetical protein
MAVDSLYCTLNNSVFDYTASRTIRLLIVFTFECGNSQRKQVSFKYTVAHWLITQSWSI